MAASAKARPSSFWQRRHRHFNMRRAEIGGFPFRTSSTRATLSFEGATAHHGARLVARTFAGYGCRVAAALLDASKNHLQQISITPTTGVSHSRSEVLCSPTE